MNLRELGKYPAVSSRLDALAQEQGRRWIRKGDELVLFDTLRGVELFRKPIEEEAPPETGSMVGMMPSTPVTAEAPQPAQPLPSGEVGIGDFNPQLSPGQLPSPPAAVPPTAPPRPTVPLTTQGPRDVTFQPQGDELDFGALTPPRPTVPIQSPPPSGVSHQPQGRDPDFGELPPPPPVGGRRLEGSPPPEWERALQRSVLEPEISDIPDADLTVPETDITPPSPRLPQTGLEAPMIKLPGEKEPRRATKLETPVELRPVTMASAAPEDSLKTMLDSTAKATGGTQDPTGGVIVTEEALLAESTPADVLTTSDRQLVIDPNLNEAKIVENGTVLQTFYIGTGDTTGTRFGKQYFTPHGTFNIMSQAPYKKVEGSYGPMWMALAHESGEKLRGPGGGGIGLHGQHAAADLNPDGPGFRNQGFVSHGCIRFEGNDILKVRDLLDVGATVRILPYRGPKEKLLARETTP